MERLHFWIYDEDAWCAVNDIVSLNKCQRNKGVGILSFDVLRKVLQVRHLIAGLGKNKYKSYVGWCYKIRITSCWRGSLPCITTLIFRNVQKLRKTFYAKLKWVLCKISILRLKNEWQRCLFLFFAPLRWYVLTPVKL